MLFTCRPQKLPHMRAIFSAAGVAASEPSSAPSERGSVPSGDTPMDAMRLQQLAFPGRTVTPPSPEPRQQPAGGGGGGMGRAMSRGASNASSSAVNEVSQSRGSELQRYA